MIPGAAERYRIRISGRVQGVFFRQFVVDEARALGLAGAVWNRRDGRVELVAEGPVPALERLVARLHEGPPAASVRDVDVIREAPVGEPEGFSVEHR